MRSDFARLEIDVREVLRLAQCGPGEKWRPLAERAIEEARPLLVPRADWVRVPDESLSGLFPSSTPVEAIARAGERWAFIATIGPDVESRVREHSMASRYLEALLLDAAGSVAMEAVCDRIERECAGNASSARFSPGYCAWTLAAQEEIFSLLDPESAGIRLQASMLMQPLKSVSGVVVRADAGALQVPPDACEQCDARGCTRRQARYSPAVGRKSFP